MWNNAGKKVNFQDKAKPCGKDLLNWEKLEFENVQSKSRELQKTLSDLQSQSQTDNIVQETHETEFELDKILKIEESMWHQRSRALWIKDGDKNSNFFHQKASQRKKRNTIRQIKNENGQWCSNRKGVERILKDYFIKLFLTDVERNIDMVVNALESKVSANMNERLKRPFTSAEVLCAVKQMHPMKAPGPDANIGYQPSYLWRSLLAARNLIMAGTSWRVGNGQQIQPWNDAWIGLVHPTKPMDDRGNDGQVTLVSDLMNNDAPSWKTDLVITLFCRKDADEILSIPLSDRRPSDRRIWKPSKNGKFSIKTAYHLAVKTSSHLPPLRASPSYQPKEWTRLWQIKTIPRVKTFIW
ncbi:hypothetical protein C2S52_022103 [Perilla frutescens var. hirtella]|nr:hypothetical protein C2S52_022103 [Perilla frutescens var. hirtella]